MNFHHQQRAAADEDEVRMDGWLADGITLPGTMRLINE